jgi:hypothetical protein
MNIKNKNLKYNTSMMIFTGKNMNKQMKDAKYGKINILK